MSRFLAVLTILIASAVSVLAADEAKVLEFKAKVGFTNGEDRIIEHRFLDDDRRLLIIGSKSLQIWDVESARLVVSVPHQISQFAPRGFVSTYLLLGIPRILDWRSFVVDENGKWIVTAERTGAGEKRSAIVRDLQTLKQLAVLELPTVSTEYITFDPNKGEIMTAGITGKIGEFANWDKAKFERTEFFGINEYKWHQKVRGGEKIIAGSGDTKVLWTGLNIKQGDTLTLRDVKTGAVEKEYTVKNLKPETAYQETTVSADEKYLISKRNDRVFVWNIDAGGDPKFEVSNPNPKGDFSLRRIVDGRFIVVKTDRQLRIYDVAADGAPVLSVAPQNDKEDLDFLDLPGNRFAVVRADNKIRLYDLQNPNAPKLEVAPADPKDTTEYHGATRDGRFFVVNDDLKAAVYETARADKPLYEIPRQSEKERFLAIRIFDDKNLLAIARVNRSEKKPSRTEFYDLANGKISFEVAFDVGYDAKFSPGDRFIYEKGTGYFAVWNTAAKIAYGVSLKTRTHTQTDPVDGRETSGETYNTETVAFSPDYRYILRSGDDVTAVFDAETGKELQVIYDAEKVKYDKKNNVKKSGYGEASWIVGGKYVAAFDVGGIFREPRTVSLYAVKK